MGHSVAKRKRFEKKKRERSIRNQKRQRREKEDVMFDTENQNTNEPLHRAVPEKKAQVCPICNGTKTVRYGFYGDKPPEDPVNPLPFEKCRTCVEGVVYR